MSPAEAKRLLLLHSGVDADVADPRWQAGFLGSLRPYRGHLVPANLHEVMAALRVLAPELEAPHVDREIMSALWGICHFGRAWGVHPAGMLRSNNLITEADVGRLETWIDCISYATTVLLDGGGIESAFQEYEQLRGNGDP